MKLILASASPRRRELLTQVGVSFVIEVSDVEEVLDDTLSPELQVQSLALQKAQAVAAQHKDGLVLGADTVVVDAGSLLGKPQNTEEAAKMLRSLSGKWHQVMTAVALVDANDTKHEWTSVEITNVKFRDLTEDDIRELRNALSEYNIEGDLRREVAMNIKRLQEINSYRGMRHKRGLPCRGQRTKTNARTRRGKKGGPIAGKKK